MTKHKNKQKPAKSVELDKTSGIALWRQIADSLRSTMIEIADDTGRLPPEPELAALFNVNRLTLRSAVTALVEEGLLSRQQGRGTYIKQRQRLKYPISRRTRFSAGIENQADTKSVHILDYKQETASAKICQKLKLDDGSQVICVETLSIADKMPVIRSTSWFNAAQFENIGQFIKDYQSITKAFQQYGIEDYVRQSTQIEARHANQEDSQDLKLAPGAIVLVTDIINTELDGTPIQYSISRMAADRITLTINN